jgi:transposase-like protein
VELLDFTLTGETTMTEDRLPLNELLQKAGDGDFLRAVAESVLQLLMEADVEGLIGAGRHERAADRLNWRNGYRDRTFDTRLGSLNLKIPKLRAGSYFVTGTAAPPRLRRLTERDSRFDLLIRGALIPCINPGIMPTLISASR